MTNKRWMTAREVADRWGMADFELLDCFGKGLMAIDQKSRSWIYQITKPIKFDGETVATMEALFVDTPSGYQPTIPIVDNARECIGLLFNDRVVFDMDHVMEFEAAHGMGPGIDAPASQVAGVSPSTPAQQYVLEQTEVEADKERTMDDPGAVAYWNYVEAGMDWIPIGEHTHKADHERLKDTPTYENTFRSIPKRAAERYAKRMGYPHPKNNKGKLMRNKRGEPVPKPIT